MSTSPCHELSLTETINVDALIRMSRLPQYAREYRALITLIGIAVLPLEEDETVPVFAIPQCVRDYVLRELPSNPLHSRLFAALMWWCLTNSDLAEVHSTFTQQLTPVEIAVANYLMDFDGCRQLWTSAFLMHNNVMTMEEKVTIMADLEKHYGLTGASASHPLAVKGEIPVPPPQCTRQMGILRAILRVFCRGLKLERFASSCELINLPDLAEDFYTGKITWGEMWAHLHYDVRPVFLETLRTRRQNDCYARMISMSKEDSRLASEVNGITRTVKQERKRFAKTMSVHARTSLRTGEFARVKSPVISANIAVTNTLVWLYEQFCNVPAYGVVPFLPPCPEPLPPPVRVPCAPRESRPKQFERVRKIAKPDFSSDFSDAADDSFLMEDHELDDLFPGEEESEDMLPEHADTPVVSSDDEEERDSPYRVPLRRSDAFHGTPLYSQEPKPNRPASPEY